MVEKYCVLWYDTETVSAIDCLYVIETDSQIKYNDVGVSRYKPERYYDRDIGYKNKLFQSKELRLIGVKGSNEMKRIASFPL